VVSDLTKAARKIMESRNTLATPYTLGNPSVLERTFQKTLDARREPSSLEGWILEVLCCEPKGSRAFLRILSTEGRGVRLCWALSKLKGTNGA